MLTSCPINLESALNIWYGYGLLFWLFPLHMVMEFVARSSYFGKKKTIGTLEK